MPSHSKAQAIAMRIAAAGKSNIGIPQSVGKEFAAADKAKGKNAIAHLPKYKGKSKNALSGLMKK